MYQNVRDLCTDPQKQDFVAPKPLESKIKKQSTNKSENAPKKKIEALDHNKNETEGTAPKKGKTVKRKKIEEPVHKPPKTKKSKIQKMPTVMKKKKLTTKTSKKYGYYIFNNNLYIHNQVMAQINFY